MQEERITMGRLRELAQTDIREVRGEGLADIADVVIDTSLPEAERVQDYLRQVRNPYCYLDHGTVVKVSFSGGPALEDCIAKYLRPENGTLTL